MLLALLLVLVVVDLAKDPRAAGTLADATDKSEPEALADFFRFA